MSKERPFQINVILENNIRRMGKAQMPESSTTTRRSIMIFLLVWLLSAAYLGINLNKGWNQYDEGTLGQTAERILHGEMPHRDFHDPYTGGLAYTNAAIFKFFGINLFWLRLFLFVFFLAWVPAIYVLARQFLNPWPAAAVTLVAVAWSVPNYPAAMPSWFNEKFAVASGPTLHAAPMEKSMTRAITSEPQRHRVHEPLYDIDPHNGATLEIFYADNALARS